MQNLNFLFFIFNFQFSTRSHFPRISQLLAPNRTVRSELLIVLLMINRKGKECSQCKHRFELILSAEASFFRCVKCLRCELIIAERIVKFYSEPIFAVGILMVYSARLFCTPILAIKRLFVYFSVEITSYPSFFFSQCFIIVYTTCSTFQRDGFLSTDCTHTHYFIISSSMPSGILFL